MSAPTKYKSLGAKTFTFRVIIQNTVLNKTPSKALLRFMPLKKTFLFVANTPIF
jgi:hypothetical protein